MRPEKSNGSRSLGVEVGNQCILVPNSGVFSVVQCGPLAANDAWSPQKSTITSRTPSVGTLARLRFLSANSGFA